MIGIDKADVIAELRATDVIDAYGIAVEARGRWRRGNECPACGGQRRGREAFAIDTELGRFKCHKCGAAGDLLSLIAMVEGWRIPQDFERVIKRAAELAGVSPDTSKEERAQRRREREHRDAQRRAADAERQRKAEASAAPRWESMQETHAVRQAMAYLEGRGLQAIRHETRFQAMRIYLPLRDIDGAIVNLVGRHIGGAEPKVRGLSNCRTAGTFGDIRMMRETYGAIVIVEGWADWLAARLTWPDRLILGAHGAGNLPLVARWTAPHAIDRGIDFVPHLDDTGRKYTDRAITEALKAGVPINRLQIIDVGDVPGANDLADHWRLFHENDTCKRVA